MQSSYYLVQLSDQIHRIACQRAVIQLSFGNKAHRITQQRGPGNFNDLQKRSSIKKRTTSQSIPEETHKAMGGSPTPSEKATLATTEGDVPEGDAFTKPGEEGGDERESWDSKWQYLLAVIGYAVGLGSVWRFPYLCQKNGGGAFLFPYLIMLAVEGIPIFYLELAVGQRLRKGAIGVWNQVSPYAGGIGVASAFVSFNVAIYYNTIIAWCLYYLSKSFQSPLPWSDCPKEDFHNGTYREIHECVKSSPTEYFWYRETLDISPDINHPERFNWKIGVCLLVAWILTYLCMAKGIASSGKVVYVTATFPYLVLVIFFVRGITLPGMEDGLKHLFMPDWAKIWDPTVWLEAGTQIFFSLGLAFGGLIAFSSYNPVHNNCFRDALVCGIINCCTAIFAAIVVFSVLGFKANLTYDECVKERDTIMLELFNTTDVTPPPPGTMISIGEEQDIPMPVLPYCDLQDILKNSASGTGLAFIVFTEAINQFPWAPVWSILFFLMLFTLGIDSEFASGRGFMAGLGHQKIFSWPKMPARQLWVAVASGFCFPVSTVENYHNGGFVFLTFD
ncbi:unnamed protein product, partial [Meganyctiphanes norvegica]